MGIISVVPGFGWTSALQGTPLIIFFIILSLSFLFLLVALHNFLLATELQKVFKQIQNVGKQAQLLNIEFFNHKEPYKHLWSEYKDTLHQLKRKDGGKEYRATFLAETFFTKEVLIDNRVWNDFFRHLPGILTGLGIIGTFAGLITGLEGFSPSEDAGSARQSLSTLLQGVKEAFHLSAFAITCAIIVTFLEKSLLAWAYKNVEKITQAIDSLYDAGAGEEYLARLVEADEANAAQTAQLKDSLVNDLKTLLTEITERQISAIGKLEGTINIRMGNIAEGIAGIGNTTNAGLTASLETLMTAFLAKMDETFGNQMQKISDSIQESSNTMQEVQQSLHELLNKVGGTATSILEDAIEQMEMTMQRSVANQEQMTEQMRQFVDELRKRMEEDRKHSIDEIRKQIEETIKAIKNIQRITLGGFDAGIASVLESLQTALAGIDKTHLDAMNQNKKLLEQFTNVTELMQTNITELRRTTTDAISGMNSGADRIKVAADHFSAAGYSVSGVLEKATPLASQMTVSTNNLGQASLQLTNSLVQHQQLRSETARNIEILQQLINQAKQEAGIKESLITDIERVAKTLSITEKQSLEYLDTVNEVLIRNFQTFGNAMTNQVSKNIEQTDEHLSKGVTLLTGVVEELGAQLVRMRRQG